MTTGTAGGGSGAGLALRAVRKQFGEAVAVDGIDLDVPAGSFFALLGPSGCGKTTTMRMINRLVEPTSGRITIDGQDVRDLPAVELRR